MTEQAAREISDCLRFDSLYVLSSLHAPALLIIYYVPLPRLGHSSMPYAEVGLGFQLLEKQHTKRANLRHCRHGGAPAVRPSAYQYNVCRAPSRAANACRAPSMTEPRDWTSSCSARRKVSQGSGAGGRVLGGAGCTATKTADSDR